MIVAMFELTIDELVFEHAKFIIVVRPFVVMFIHQMLTKAIISDRVP